jgi:hypothetical protein
MRIMTGAILIGPGLHNRGLLLLRSLFQVLWDATHVDQLAMEGKDGRMGVA